MKIVIATAVMVFSIFVSISPSFASTDTYDSGRDHGCDEEELVVEFIGIEAWSELCACANAGS